MRHLYTFTLKLIVVLFLVGPLTTQAQTTNAEYRAVLIQLIATLQQQIETLQAQLAAQTQSYILTSGQSVALSSQVDLIATHQIEDPVDVTYLTDPAQQAYFERVMELFPETYANKLSQVAVFAAKDAPFDAFVETVPPTHKTWRYAVSEEMLGNPESSWNTELIVHELAHIIAYDPIAGMPTSAEAHCVAYFQERGCPTDNAYLAQFVDQFWSARDLDRTERFANATDQYEKAYSYYDAHQSHFVSDYAAVAPEEDFAESFMYFALGKQVPGALANEKIDFFAQYPELRVARQEIRAAR